MHEYYFDDIAYCPIYLNNFYKIIPYFRSFPIFVQRVLLNIRFLKPILTIMHICIMLYMYVLYASVKVGVYIQLHIL